VKKIYKPLIFVLMLLLLAAAVAVYSGPHFGWRIDCIVSESMEPEMGTGTLVVAVAVKPEEVKVGDIIIYHPVAIGESDVCHRVVEVKHNSPFQFITKGDAQNSPDLFPVPEENLLGKVLFHVALLGYSALFIKTLPGFLICLVLPGFTAIAICFRSIWDEATKKRRNNLQKTLGEAIDR
jgi:signal peptidase I